jgi:hypothetical protein
MPYAFPEQTTTEGGVVTTTTTVVANTNSNNNDGIAKLKKEYMERLSNQKERCQQKLRKNVELEKERWKKKLDTEKQKHETELRQEQERGKKELDRALRSHGKVVEGLKSRQEATLTRERQSHQKAVETLKTRHEAALAREKARSSKHVEKEKEKLKDHKRIQKQKKRALAEGLPSSDDEDDDDNNNINNNNNNGIKKKRPRVEKNTSNKDNVHHIKWKRRFEELERYKEMYGDCNAPITELDPDIKALGGWCATQRTHYRFLKQGKPTSLTRERIQLLEGLGFVWSVGPEVLPFEQRLDQLKEYLNENGNCNVPQKQGPLGDWVLGLRKRYREQRLPADRITILEEMGFQWSLRNRGGPLEQRMAKAAPDRR